MSPRLPSSITSRPACRAWVSTRSSAATPADPNASKKADWGLTAGTSSATPSITALENASAARAAPARSLAPSSSSGGSSRRSGSRPTTRWLRVASTRSISRSAKCETGGMGRAPVYDPRVSSGARIGPASAAERIALVADDGSFDEWDAEVASDDPLSFNDTKPYRLRLSEARQATGLSEAVLTGRATLDGRPFVLIAGEFGFLGGSIGVATAERVARAFERALAERLPVVALPASGGSRMQEGTLAVVGMAKLAAAAGRLRAAGLPYVVCLTDPTMGGVLASWGSLGTVTFALPDTAAGFAGPRVVELLTGRSLPARVQRGETLLAHGLLDEVVAPEALRSRVAAVLAVAAGNEGEGTGAPARPAPASPFADPARSPSLDARPDPATRDAWASLRHVRDRRRPGAAAVLDALAADVTMLRGARDGRPDDPACFAALARVTGFSTVVVAQRRRGDG